MRVSSAEFMKNYGALADRALVEPVTITRNGRDRLVVVSAEEYARLKRRDRQAFLTEELDAETIAAIARSEPAPQSEAFNHEMDAHQMDNPSRR